MNVMHRTSNGYASHAGNLVIIHSVQAGMKGKPWIAEWRDYVGVKHTLYGATRHEITEQLLQYGVRLMFGRSAR